MKSFLAFKIVNKIFLYFEKILTQRHLAVVHDSDFVKLYIHRLARCIFHNYSSSPNGPLSQ